MANTQQLWYEQQAPQTAEQWSQLGKAAFEGELDTKTQELVAVASSSVLRCPHCTRAHIEAAQKAGASSQEISEALMIAALITSGTQLFWMIDDYEQLLGGGDSATPWFIEQAGSMGKQWKSFHDGVYEDSALDRKTKELVATAVGCLGRCPHCTKTHIKGALEYGASKQEVTETLMTAALLGAGTQLTWMKEDYQQLLS